MLAPYFDAIAAWQISRTINESTWIFAFVQALHLVGLALLAGSVLLVDLRLMGKGLTNLSIAQVARDARPWLVWSLVAMVLTGVPQFISLATKEYENDYFWRKMYFLVAALIFTFVIKQRIVMAPEGRFGSAVGKVVALISIFLWAMVAINGRLIGLLS
jgi:hypothetical protein